MKQALLALLLLSACSTRNTTWRVEPHSKLPQWVLDEWSQAQDELLELPGIEQDPRRFTAHDWEWIQLSKPFTHYLHENGQKRLHGLTIYSPQQIIICCGYRETVRHEAFHSILYLMGDSRYRLHYPELLSD